MMLKFIIFCTLAILALATEREVNIIEASLAEDIVKVESGDDIADIDLTKIPTEVQPTDNSSDAISLTEIPEILAAGMNGSGIWLAGILDSIKDMNATNFTHGIINTSNHHLQNSDAVLKFDKLAMKYGYPVEEYEVETKDGYLLRVFRIPYGIGSPQVQGVRRPVVFLMHGLIDSSDNWIILGPQKSLGYLLADAGYDVWFGNARGNKYSRTHISKEAFNSDFWDFSWDEIGRFDLPAMIDSILKETGEEKLYYIGHSQGTTSFFVMTSMRPAYNNKIRVMYALAPIAFMSHMVSPIIRLIASESQNLDWITRSMGIGEFLPSNQLFQVMGRNLCNEKFESINICYNAMFIVCGFDLNQVDPSTLPTIMGHVPAGSSIKQFLHYGQGVVSTKFARYDFGTSLNLKKYGSAQPPEYDLKKITAPVILFYSQNDWLSHPKDVDNLALNLGNIVNKILVPIKYFNHMDYLWAKDIDSAVNRKILSTIVQF